MNIDTQLIPQSIIFNIASMGVRLLPRGRHRIFLEGRDLYSLFRLLYQDMHPDITQEDFFLALRHVFPVYKNPRKDTDIYKITTYKLQERLRQLGMSYFPIDALANNEGLKIEM